MKIATWNVNSLKVRLSQVIAWLELHQPDILLLQEIKMINADFPSAVFLDAGYHAVFSGQKAYNGVACLSKKPVNHILFDFPNYVDDARRMIAFDFQDVRVINVYVPNGESTTSEKYQYKLKWLFALKTFLQTELSSHKKLCLCGDFNIAPHDLDVHDPKRWKDKVLCSALEREAFSGLLELGLEDVFRTCHPELKKYSWWDYRLQGFQRNWGLRIDHILATPSLVPLECEIDAVPRSHERPSDHAPVLATFS